jgi:hypothetical protein
VDHRGPVYREMLGPMKQLFHGLAQWTMTQTFINKTKYFNRLVKFMQKRMKAKCETIEAKVEVIDTFWGK